MGRTITIGGLEIDPERFTVHCGETEPKLTAVEFKILLLLAANPGKVYSRERLLDIILGIDYQGDVRTVDVHIRRLREKLEVDPADPKCFNTKWGVGYYFGED